MMMIKEIDMNITEAMTLVDHLRYVLAKGVERQYDADDYRRELEGLAAFFEMQADLMDKAMDLQFQEEEAA